VSVGLFIRSHVRPFRTAVESRTPTGGEADVNIVVRMAASF
jgi:hypothetical protein